MERGGDEVVHDNSRLITFHSLSDGSHHDVYGCLLDEPHD